MQLIRQEDPNSPVKRTDSIPLGDEVTLPILGGQANFRIAATVEHLGGHANDGHYICHILQDDRQVSHTISNQIGTNCNLILFLQVVHNQ